MKKKKQRSKKMKFHTHTKLEGGNLDNYFSERSTSEKLIDELELLGQWKDDQREFSVKKAKDLVKVLNSPNSAQRKTKKLFSLCVAMLDSLQNQRYQKSTEVLYCFIVGLYQLLRRYSSLYNDLLIKIQNHDFAYASILIEGKHIYGNFAYTNKKGELYQINRNGLPPLCLDGIINAVNHSLYAIPYEVFVRRFIPYLIGISLDCRLNEEKNHSKLFLKNFLAPIIEAFLPAEQTILAKEMKELFGGINLFPEKINRIIHHYVDSRSICFFEKRGMLINDHNFPEDPLEAKWTKIFDTHYFSVKNMSNNLIHDLVLLAHPSEGEQNFFSVPSLEDVIPLVTSPNSSLKKSERLYFLCWTMLDGLKNQRFEDNSEVLYCLIVGLKNLFTRYLDPCNDIRIETEDQNIRTSFPLISLELPNIYCTFVSLDEKSGSIYTLKKFLPHLSIDDITKVINQLCRKISYDKFVKKFIPYLLQFSYSITVIQSPEIRPLQIEMMNLFNLIRKAFQSAEQSILDEERRRFFNINFFPANIEQIIHQYTDSRAISFFERREGYFLEELKWRKNLDNYFTEKNTNDLIDDFQLLGTTITDQNTFSALSLNEIIPLLVTSNSVQTKTRRLFTLCWAILDGLKDQRFEKNLDVFYCLMVGLKNLLIRYISICNTIVIQTQAPAMIGAHTILSIEEKNIYATFVSVNENRATLNEKTSIPYISLDEIISVIKHQLDNKIPYDDFVKRFIPFLLEFSYKINSHQLRKQTLSNSKEYLLMLNFFNQIQEAFLPAKQTVLAEERNQLFNCIGFLPNVITTIIYYYADSRTICFFEKETRLINDHNFPEEKDKKLIFRDQKAAEWRKNLENDYFSGKNIKDNLINDLNLLGLLQNDRIIIQVPSFNDALPILSSPDRAQAKTKKLFSLCWAMLDGLKNQQFEENLELLYCFITGLKNLFIRCLRLGALISIRTQIPQRTYNYTLLGLAEKNIYSTFVNTDEKEVLNKDVEDLLPHISIDTIIKVINQQCLKITYDNFVKKFIPDILQFAVSIDSVQGERIRPVKIRIIDFFNLIRKAFQPARRSILAEERRQLFNGVDLFPKNVEKIIHRYADSRLICFFEKRDEEINDLNFPQTNVKAGPGSTL